MVTDQLSDLLTRIRNAQRSGHLAVSVPASKMKKRILEVLQEEGFIVGYEEGNAAEGKSEEGKPQLRVQLRYDSKGQPAIKELRRISSPGRRIFVGKEKIPQNRGGLGVVIVSTSQGVMSDNKARELGVGGELVCSVF